MTGKYTLPAVLLGVLSLLPFSILAATSSVRTVSQSKYSLAHSLGDNYVFDPRDGWKSMNATNLQYKYPRDIRLDATNPTALERRKDKDSKLGLGGIIKELIKGIKAIGKPQIVTITWYIGIMIGEMISARSCYLIHQGTQAMISKILVAGQTGNGNPQCALQLANNLALALRN